MVRLAEVIEDLRSGVRSTAEALQDQQDGHKGDLLSHLCAKTAQPGRPWRATCDTQRPECNIKLGFQPSQTLNLLSNPFPQPRVWPPAHPGLLLLPKPNRQVPTSRTQKWLVCYVALSTKRCRQDVVSAATYELRYSGMTSHIGG